MADTLNKTGKTPSVAERQVRLEIIGVGNPLAGDDSAGIELVRRLKARYPGSARHFRTSFQGGVELLDILPQADVVLFVDAVESGASPGTLHLVPLPSRSVVPRGIAALSGHGWSLTETLELAGALRLAVPPLLLLGIEVGRFAPGKECSPEVARAISLAVEDFPSIEARLREMAPN